MKALFIITGVLAVVFLVSQVYVAFTMRNIEYQEYEVIRKDGAIEIRYYPEAILASTTGPGTYAELQGTQFRVLANYIFGGNEENQKIDMTSPVAMEMQQDQMKMSFVMPSEWSFENLPETADDRITFERTDPKYMAAVRFGGFADDTKIETAKEELTQWLDENELTPGGHYAYLGYNPPWQVVNRRNEVVVALKDFKSP